MLNGLVLIVLGVYGGAVLWNRNLDDLATLIGEEGAFVEWAVALAILYSINKSEYFHPIGKLLLSVAVTGLAVNVITKTNAASLLADVAQGRMGFAEAFRQVVPLDGSAATEEKEK